MLAQQVLAQTIFDKFEDFIIERNLEIHYGPQWTWYKQSDIRYVDPKYGRDINFQSTKGQNNNEKDFVLWGEIGVPQHRWDVGINLSERYMMSIMATHFTYEVDVDRTYYRLGTWNGQAVSDSIFMRDDFDKLEHSNGINTYNIGIGRKFNLAFKNNEKHNLSMILKPNIGILYTASQGSIKNPDGIMEHYNQNNSVSGFNYGFTTEFKLHLFKHFNLGINYNYFQLWMANAKLHETAYIKQELRGFNYGFFVGYQF